MSETGGELSLTRVHHVGVSVVDMDRSIAFWGAFLGVAPSSRRMADAPFLGSLTGYPGVVLEIAWLDLPGGLLLELLRFENRKETPLPHGTAHGGAVHLCIDVVSLDKALLSALEAGATLASVAPIEVPGGPNAGARYVYLRDPDGVSIELRQPPP